MVKKDDLKTRMIINPPSRIMREIKLDIQRNPFVSQKISLRKLANIEVALI